MEIAEKLTKLMRAKKYVPCTIRELAAELGLSRRELPSLEKTLSGMLASGEIARVKGDRYGASADLDLFSGTIEFRQNGWAKIVGSDGKRVLEVRPEDTGVALNGDKVLARISAPVQYGRPRRTFGKRKNPDPGGSETFGKVVRILERKNTKVIGTLLRSYNFWHVVPDDPRFFYDVIVEAPECSKVFPRPRENDKVVLVLNEWKQRHMNPSGRIVGNFGQSHTPAAEYQAILSKYELSESFPPAVLSELNSIPEEVSEMDVNPRLDVRGDFTVTIDPEDAKDFDDAISLKKVEGGGWKVGVHIADVSHYVRPNTAIDAEARKRGNSTYLVGTVIPMLPFKLSNGVCSLVEDEDRLVKSVFLTFDAGGDCTDVFFSNSVIRSDKRLNYEQARSFIVEDDIGKIAAVKPSAEYETAYTGKPLSELSKFEMEKIRSGLRRLWGIASILRKRRMRMGSLDIEIPEFKIFCDKDGYADRIKKSENDESHQLVEEFMLAANEAVARELSANKIPFISRVHDSPDAEKLDELREELATFGVTCGNLTSRREMLKLLSSISRHPQNYILKTKVLRSMKRAVYRASSDGHYGLNKAYYAHFTSPIRRYADLSVHRCVDRLMQKKVTEGSLKAAEPLPSRGVLEETAAHISRTEQNSAEAERESRKIKLMEYFERRTGPDFSFEATVTSVLGHGFFVELTESSAFGFVHVHTMHDDIYRLNPSGSALCGRRTRKQIKAGDTVTVQVESVDRFKRQIDFRLSGPDRPSKNKGGHGKRPFRQQPNRS